MLELLSNYWSSLRARIEQARQNNPTVSIGALARRAGMNKQQLSRSLRQAPDARISTVVRLERALRDLTR